MGQQGEELVLEVTRGLRPVSRGLLPLHEARDVAGDQAGVHEPGVTKESAAVDQDPPDGSIAHPDARLVGINVLAPREPVHDVARGLRVDQELGDVMTDVLKKKLEGAPPDDEDRPLFELRQRLGLDRKRCAVGAVGARFSLERGLDPGGIAR